jgi:hypothetical protein
VKGAQTLMRALDILDEVIDGPIRAVDLARKLGMNRRRRTALPMRCGRVIIWPSHLMVSRLAPNCCNWAFWPASRPITPASPAPDGSAFGPDRLLRFHRQS